ncbi:Protein OSB1, mitochondrial [Linum grandiflorum]
MALQQLSSLAFSSKVHLCFPSKLLASGNSTGSSSITSLQPRFKPYRRLKCSANYRDYEQNNQAVVGHERPAEIPWKKELCNTVQLIGIVDGPVEMKDLPSGKVVAWTRLGFKKSAADTCWINLTFWDELARSASQHLQQGNQIYVCGRLISDAVENEEGKVATYYKQLVVQQFNFIERNGSSFSSYSEGSSNMNGSANRKFNSNTSNMGSIEEQWQAFFASPSEWWDNRKNKRNSKYPDFKHKTTGEALWVEGRYNPSWVKSQLAVLDERLGTMARDEDDNSRRDISSLGSNEFLSF